MLSKPAVGAIVKNELDAALDYNATLAKKRETLLNYYNARPYGDEVEGQSRFVTSDVADTIEWMVPSLLRVFTQGKVIAVFDPLKAQDEQESDEKTFLANHAFLVENNGVLVLHDMFKDALLQYIGVVKVYWDDTEETVQTKYKGLSELEFQKLQLDDDVTIEEFETEEEEGIGTVYNANVVRIKKEGCVRYMNVPPDEFVLSKSARNFDKPTFIGHRSPKTRSDLVSMGFDRDQVDALPADEYYELNGQKQARYYDLDNWQDQNPGGHSPNDIIYLGEYYARIDVNEDGITELWQVYYAGEEVLSMEQVDDHPFAVCVPVPQPHKAIGTCPAEQVADIQYLKSTLVRQSLNNVYQSNYPRILHSNSVELDDLLTPRAGGLVGVDTAAGDVAGHVQMLQVSPMIDGLMQMIEYTDTMREIRTGVTRYSQGLDLDALNKTATAFTGMTDASQQRLDLIARVFADGGVKQIFMKTVKLLGKYQDDSKTIRVMGKSIDIDPAQWSSNLNCRIDVGIGSGDRQEKIANLSNVLNYQMMFMQNGLVLADQAKVYKTLEKLVTETGLKDAALYFNNPEMPEQTLMAQLQQAMAMIQQLQQAAGDPYMKAEEMKAKAKLIEAQSKQDIEAARIAQNQQQFDEKLRFDIQKQIQDMAKQLTELELKYNTNVPGSAV